MLDVPEFFTPPVISYLISAFALDWDSDTEQIFWTDIIRRTINVANLDVMPSTDLLILIIVGVMQCQQFDILMA